MFSLQLFEETGTEIRTMVEPGTGVAWFHSGHLGEVLEFSTPSRYLPTVLDDHEYKEVKTGVGRPSLFVREEGVYMLIMASKSPSAMRFKKWLAYEVLPKIRRQGQFGESPNKTSEASPFWDLIDSALQRGIDPERAIDLHHRMNEGSVAKRTKPPSNAPSPVDPSELVNHFVASVDELIAKGLLDDRSVVFAIRRHDSSQWMSICMAKAWPILAKHSKLTCGRAEIEQAIRIGGGEHGTQKFRETPTSPKKSLTRKCLMIKSPI